MTEDRQWTQEEIKKIGDERNYQDLVKSFQNQVSVGRLSERGYELFKEGLRKSMEHENVAYSRLHLRIYGMLRQAIEYVHSQAPELTGEMLAATKAQCGDIVEAEWSIMTENMSIRPVDTASTK